MYIRREPLMNEFKKWLRLDGDYDAYESSGIHPIENIAVSALMTIEEAPSVNVVSEEVYKQVRWERDMAIQQLESIGLHFGQKTDGVAKVVRCKDCVWCKEYEKNVEYDGSTKMYYCELHSSYFPLNRHDVFLDGYCSEAERK